MGWAKFDDQFTDHPKVVAAGPWAELLAMRAVIFCARYETDGHVQTAQLQRLALGIPSPKKQVDRLLDVGLWELDDDGDGWWVHDFLEYHPSREDKDEEREAARERMRRVRANKKRTRGKRSAEQTAKFGERSDYPDPTPPQEEPSTSDDADASPPEEIFDEPVVALTRRLAVRVRDNGHKVPTPGTKNAHGWFVEIDRLLRLDGADPEDVAAVIDWATADSFWKANIRSAGKFREQFSVLRLRMLNARPTDVNAASGGFVE